MTILELWLTYEMLSTSEKRDSRWSFAKQNSCRGLLLWRDFRRDVITRRDVISQMTTSHLSSDIEWHHQDVTSQPNCIFGVYEEQDFGPIRIQDVKDLPAISEISVLLIQSTQACWLSMIKIAAQRCCKHGRRVVRLP